MHLIHQQTASFGGSGHGSKRLQLDNNNFCSKKEPSEATGNDDSSSSCHITGLQIEVQQTANEDDQSPAGMMANINFNESRGTIIQ